MNLQQQVATEEQAQDKDNEEERQGKTAELSTSTSIRPAKRPSTEAGGDAGLTEMQRIIELTRKAMESRK